MKRMCWILIGTAVMLSTTGCQHGMFRRGARCRPGLSMPSLGLPRLFNHQAAPPPAAVAQPGCNSGCNSGGPVGPPTQAYAPGPYMTGEVGYPSGEFYVGEGAPMVTEGPMQQVQQRPIITGPSESPRVISDVPGPESAPLPN